MSGLDLIQGENGDEPRVWELKDDVGDALHVIEHEGGPLSGRDFPWLIELQIPEPGDRFGCVRLTVEQVRELGQHLTQWADARASLEAALVKVEAHNPARSGSLEAA